MASMTMFCAPPALPANMLTVICAPESNDVSVPLVSLKYIIVLAPGTNPIGPIAASAQIDEASVFSAFNPISISGSFGHVTSSTKNPFVPDHPVACNYL